MSAANAIHPSDFATVAGAVIERRLASGGRITAAFVAGLEAARLQPFAGDEMAVAVFAGDFEAGALAERERFRAVLEHPSAAGRTDMAVTLLNSPLDPDAIVAVLSAVATGSAIPPIAERGAGPEIGFSISDAVRPDAGEAWAKVARRYPDLFKGSGKPQ